MSISRFPRNGGGRRRAGLLFCAWFGLVAASGVKAVEPLYQNTQSLQFYSPPTVLNPPNSPPQIDATVFDNEGSFELFYNNLSIKPAIYQTSDTLYFTNGDNGLLVVASPLPGTYLTNNLVTEESIGAGFEFNDKTSFGNQWADTFYNSGTIRCNSILDGGSTLFPLAVCDIFATNVYNPGNIDLGIQSQLQISGSKVDLSRSVLNVEGLQYDYNQIFGPNVLVDNLNVGGFGAVGSDTNYDWNPGGQPLVFPYDFQYPLTLSPTNAISSEPYILALSNSASYFRIDVDPNNASNIIYRAIFVQNNSPTAPYNVYINPLGFSTINEFAGLGTLTVEWTGYYTDPATGNSFTNYLYLDDDAVLGASTNAMVYGGQPNNFTLFASTTPQFTGIPTNAPGFLPVFANQAITNPYSYMNAQITASTVATNATSGGNINGSVTNLIGRIQINAGQELNLNNAEIVGDNYLSIQATNQFDGSQGATIDAPFADINVGVTNGSLAVTNLLESAIPNWSGILQAWSTRWLVVTNGVTNDFRVMLVYSQLQPISQPWVQNLALRTGTNHLTISDVLNVYGSFYTDARDLTITTNGTGFGATSTEGQLDTIFSGNLGTGNWPNLSWVTNYGVLGSQGIIVLTNLAPAGTGSPFGAVVNAGIISDQGMVVWATNFTDGGTITNGIGAMSVRSRTTTLTNATIYAGGNVSISAGALTATNVQLQCLSLTLYPTNFLSDGVPNFLGGGAPTNGNYWTVGRTNGTGGLGFALLNNPTNGDLLGTTITNICPASNKLDANTWAGRDFGAVNAGFTNNAALGHLVLNVAGANSLITFNGTGASNALYVDALEFQGALTNGITSSYNFTNWLALNTNITIYFAQAYVNGISVAEKINEASVYSGYNGGLATNGVVLRPGRLRWVPTYAGNFSSTNFVVGGVTNYYNAALAESKDIDSNGNGIPNASDASPFFTAQQMAFTLSLTNSPVREALLTWDTVPFATNSVYYTSILTTNNWLLYTNFLSTNVAGPAYPVTVPDTNVWHGIRFYKVVVQPWLTYPQ